MFKSQATCSNSKSEVILVEVSHCVSIGISQMPSKVSCQGMRTDTFHLAHWTLKPVMDNRLVWMQFTASSIPGFVRYRSIPEFCSILDTYIVSLIFIQSTVPSTSTYATEVVLVRYQNSSISIDQYSAGLILQFFDIDRYQNFI